MKIVKFKWDEKKFNDIMGKKNTLQFLAWLYQNNITEVWIENVYEMYNSIQWIVDLLDMVKTDLRKISHELNINKENNNA